MCQGYELHVRVIAKAIYKEHTGIALPTGKVVRQIVGTKSFIDYAHKAFVEKWTAAVSQPAMIEGVYSFMVVVDNNPDGISAIRTFFDVVYHNRDIASADVRKTYYNYHIGSCMRNITHKEYKQVTGNSMPRGYYAYVIYNKSRAVCLSFRDRMAFKGHDVSRVVQIKENYAFFVCSEYAPKEFRENDYSWFRDNYCEYAEGDDGRIYDRYGFIYSEYKNDLFCVINKAARAIYPDDKDRRVMIYREYDRLFDVALRAGHDAPCLSVFVNMLEAEKPGAGYGVLNDLEKVRRDRWVKFIREDMSNNTDNIAPVGKKEIKSDGLFMKSFLIVAVLLGFMVYASI